MDSLSVEYEILIDDQHSFCDSEITLLNFLSANSKFRINREKTKIDFKPDDDENPFSVKYWIELDKTTQENKTRQRIFRVKFTHEFEELDENHSFLAPFSCFLKEFKSNVYNHLNPNIYTLRNDISLQYSKLAYPAINITENLLRKLILKFFLKSTGSSWYKENIVNRSEIQTELKIQNSKKDEEQDRKQEESFLHQIDFAKLSIILTTPFRWPPKGELEQKIQNATASDQIDIDLLKSYLPKSFWSRHFSHLVDLTEKDFRSKWKRLYDLRCKVAHNRFINESDYKEIMELTSSLNEVFQNILKEIEIVKVSAEEIEEIEHNASQIIDTVDLVMRANKKAEASIGAVEDSLKNFIQNSNYLDIIAAKAIVNGYPHDILAKSIAGIHYPPELPASIKAILGRYNISDENLASMKALLGLYLPETDSF